MLRSTLRLLVMGMVVFFLFGEEPGQSYECEYRGWDCKGSGCGFPSSPGNSTGSRWRVNVFKCCVDGGDFMGPSCYETEVPTYSCC